jgi:hypothetical protein
MIAPRFAFIEQLPFHQRLPATTTSVTATPWVRTCGIRLGGVEVRAPRRLPRLGTRRPGAEPASLRRRTDAGPAPGLAPPSSPSVRR